jgi:hypothetical protein
MKPSVRQQRGEISSTVSHSSVQSLPETKENGIGSPEKYTVHINLLKLLFCTNGNPLQHFIPYSNILTTEYLGIFYYVTY